MTNKKNTQQPATGHKQHNDKDQAQAGRNKSGKERVTGGTNPDESPEKKIRIDDNPDETKRKVPNMGKSL